MLVAIELYFWADHYGKVLSDIYDDSSVDVVNRFPSKLDYFVNTLDFKSGDVLDDVNQIVIAIRHQAINICTKNTSASFVCIIALSSVVDSNIRCIYSARENNACFHTMNRVLYPRDPVTKPEKLSITLLWYSTEKRKVQLNHFVPFFKKSIIKRSLQYKTTSSPPKSRKRQLTMHSIKIPFKTRLLSYEKDVSESSNITNELTSKLLEEKCEHIPLSSNENPGSSTSEDSSIQNINLTNNTTIATSSKKNSLSDYFGKVKTDPVTIPSKVVPKPTISGKKDRSCEDQCCTNPKVRGQPVVAQDKCNPFDIGLHIQNVKSMTDNVKYNLIKNIWEPPCVYKFSKYFANNRHWTLISKYVNPNDPHDYW